MRNVTRPLKPDSLEKDGQKWTKKLLNQIKKSEDLDKRTPDSYYNHYNQNDVKRALLSMYKGFCCYCESRVDGIIDESEVDDQKIYGHIEHLKPKRKFPLYCYDWENLHLACADCNTAKGEKYNTINPILDPSKDIPLNNYYTFELEGLGLWFKPLELRAETTEKDADLNRKNLLLNRLKVLNNIINIYLELKKQNDEIARSSKIRQLEKLAKEDEYGSVIRWALDNFF